MPAKKQTAANNPFLAGVKVIMNQKIFAHAARDLNSEGEAAALKYLQQFFSVPVSVEFFSGRRWRTMDAAQKPRSR